MIAAAATPDGLPRMPIVSPPSQDPSTTTIGQRRLGSSRQPAVSAATRANGPIGRALGRVPLIRSMSALPSPYRWNCRHKARGVSRGR